MLIKCFLFLAALLMSAALGFRGNWMRRRQASGVDRAGSTWRLPNLLRH